MGVAGVTALVYHTDRTFALSVGALMTSLSLSLPPLPIMPCLRFH